MLERMCGVKLSSLNNVHTKYLVEVFKYPGTGNCIPTDAEDGFGSTPMIGLYGLVEPYSIMHITTMQSGVMTKDREEEIDVQKLLLALRLRGAESPFSQQSLSHTLASVPALYHQWVFPY